MSRLLLILAASVFVAPSLAFAQAETTPVVNTPDPSTVKVTDLPAITPTQVTGVPPAPNSARAGNDTVSVVPDASSPAEPADPKFATTEKEISDQVSYLSPKIKVDLIPSLFFTKWEHDLIADARKGLKTRPVGPPEDSAISDGLAGPREISLSGIVYKSGKDWVIWLNNKRIAPDAIPSEVMDLKVYKDHIKLEWFDKDTNQIFPIKLRPHQRFHLDSRMFLPGSQ